MYVIASRRGRGRWNIITYVKGRKEKALASMGLIVEQERRLGNRDQYKVFSAIRWERMENAEGKEKK